MDYPDLSSLMPDEPSTQEKAAAMTAALRGQRNFAAIAQLTGDPVLSKLGTSQMEDAHQQQQLGQQGEDRRLTRALAAQQHAQQQQYQQGELADRQQQIAQTEKHQTAQEGLQRAALEQGKYSQGGFGVLNNRTGELAPMTKQGTAKPGDLDKVLAGIRDDIDPYKGRNGEILAQQKRVDQAEHLLALIEASHGNPDRRQMEELAIGGNSLISPNSGGAASQVAALVPKTLMGNASGIAEYFSNDPTGTNQPEFVKRMKDMIEREKGVSASQIRQAQISRLSSHQGGHAAYPEQTRNFARQYLKDLPDADLDQVYSGTYKGPTAGAGATPTHYLYSPDRKQRRPADAAGNPIGPAEANPNG